METSAQYSECHLTKLILMKTCGSWSDYSDIWLVSHARAKGRVYTNIKGKQSNDGKLPQHCIPRVSSEMGVLMAEGERGQSDAKQFLIISQYLASI